MKMFEQLMQCFIYFDDIQRIIITAISHMFPVEMVLAVPHVHRDRQDYLIPTLHSLFTQMSETQKAQTVIVVMVAEPFNETEFDVVVKEVSAE